MKNNTLDENGYVRYEIDYNESDYDDMHIRIEPLREYRLTEEDLADF